MLACFKGVNLAAFFAVARKRVDAVWSRLKGYFSTLIEPTPLLRRKLREIAKEIGTQRLGAMGYSRVFTEEKLETLITTT